MTAPRRFAIRLPRPLWSGVAAVVLIVLGIGLRIGLPFYRQHVAIQEIDRAGGTVGIKERGPEWLRARLGDERMELFYEVRSVFLGGSDATDATLAYVTSLPSLEELWLDNPHVTDAGMKHLQELTSLRKLSLTNTLMTDSGLPHLKRLRGLQYLSLKNTHVTDAGVAQLQRALPKVFIFK